MRKDYIIVRGNRVADTGLLRRKERFSFTIFRLVLIRSNK